MQQEGLLHFYTDYHEFESGAHPKTLDLAGSSAESLDSACEKGLGFRV
jgi:hypothetical protein